MLQQEVLSNEIIMNPSIKNIYQKIEGLDSFYTPVKKIKQEIRNQEYLKPFNHIPVFIGLLISMFIFAGFVGGFSLLTAVLIITLPVWILLFVLSNFD